MQTQIPPTALTTVFVLCLTVVFCACANSSNHEKYVREYVAIQRPSYQVLPLIGHYKLVKSAIENRQLKNGYTPDPEYIDSIENCNNALQYGIANNVKIIEGIVELDTGLKPRETTLYFLSSLSQTFAKYTTKYARICELGAYQAKSRSNSNEWDVRGVQAMSDSLGRKCAEALYQFQVKYKITDGELTKHGLPEAFK